MPPRPSCEVPACSNSAIDRVRSSSPGRGQARRRASYTPGTVLSRHRWLGTQHAGQQTGQFVVVGEHQSVTETTSFSLATGSKPARQQPLDAAAHVQVMAAALEIALLASTWAISAGVPETGAGRSP